MRIQSYETEKIIVTFDPSICAHSGNCVRSLPAVFDVGRKRWIQPEWESVDKVIATVRACPSGALQFKLKEKPAAG